MAQTETEYLSALVSLLSPFVPPTEEDMHGQRRVHYKQVAKHNELHVETVTARTLMKHDGYHIDGVRMYVGRPLSFSSFTVTGRKNARRSK